MTTKEEIKRAIEKELDILKIKKEIYKDLSDYLNLSELLNIIKTKIKYYEDEINEYEK